MWTKCYLQLHIHEEMRQKKRTLTLFHKNHQSQLNYCSRRSLTFKSIRHTFRMFNSMPFSDCTNLQILRYVVEQGLRLSLSKLSCNSLGYLVVDNSSGCNQCGFSRYTLNDTRWTRKWNVDSSRIQDGRSILFWTRQLDTFTFKS